MVSRKYKNINSVYGVAKDFEKFEEKLKTAFGKTFISNEDLQKLKQHLRV